MHTLFAQTVAWFSLFSLLWFVSGGHGILDKSGTRVPVRGVKMIKTGRTAA